MGDEFSLANIELGETYVDDVTGFSGKATSRLISISEPEIVHLSNETDERWVSVNRLKTEDGASVLETSAH